MKRKTSYTTDMTKQKLQRLLDRTDGRFFSVEFVKLNGEKRVANGHIVKKGDVSPRSLRDKGYCVFRDRNTQSFVATHPERLLSFQCGEIFWKKNH
jgi:hypothetical protein